MHAKQVCLEETHNIFSVAILEPNTNTAQLQLKTHPGRINMNITEEGKIT
jgi:hypothetical protein